MSRFKRYLPSPALLVAIAALVVALGGVAYATIPGSDGVIHGCYQNKVGTLRVIDPSTGAQCNTAAETPIQWNQAGSPGTSGATIIGRATATGPPADQGGDSSNIVVSNATFTNPANNTDNLFLVKATYTPPSSCTTGGPPKLAFFTVSVDGQKVLSGGGPGMGIFDTAPLTEMLEGSAVSLGAGSHTLSVTGGNYCTGAGEQGTFNIKIDTVAIP